MSSEVSRIILSRNCIMHQFSFSTCVISFDFFPLLGHINNIAVSSIFFLFRSVSLVLNDAFFFIFLILGAQLIQTLGFFC